MKTVYFDYAATTPTDPAVVEAMQPFFYEQFGNASSPHSIGQKARKAVEDSRGVLANFIGASPSEIVFTSSATESNNQAILTMALSLFGKGRHVICSSIEHHSVLEGAHRLGKLGFQVSFMQPDKDGLIDPQAVGQLIRQDTILIAIHHANNEIGTIEPVEQIGAIAREKGICFLVDATQSVGHIPVDVQKIKCDLLSLSGHKFYGPPGIGALYVRQGIAMEPRLYGGDQEQGRRAGTLNLPGIVGLGKAIELCHNQMSQEAQQQTKWRDQIIEYVLTNISGSKLNGHRQNRLPNNAHFSFERVDGEELVTALDMSQVALSQGSACTWGSLEPSHVLKAIGLSDREALGSLRVSLGRWTTQEEINSFLPLLKDKVTRLRN